MEENETTLPLQNGCDDQWIWNRWERSPDVKFFGRTYRTAHFHINWSAGTAGVRGTRILNNGRYFWELRITQRIFGTSMMFGIGTKKSKLHANSFTNLFGQDDQSWALSHKGLLWHSGKTYSYTKPFQENQSTRIGILFDGIAGTLTYYKDGECLGVAFSGLNEIKEPLYPVICSSAARTAMTLSSMKREFVNLQDRCRAVIVKKLRCRSSIDKLMVPAGVKCYLAEAIVDEIQPFKPMYRNICNSIGSL
ncbi:SPRY domain-containing SOCS box protein 3 [Onthophagus taurus]|uniref:SPRY domain-containing SOCS box protein 3 n=1 Tax=Onthophagus taurus TaxID=166361 RepID=UPI000C20F272|nr:SPRY domain-containing SOCS box protein 3 [Onthophagus taurus]